VDVVRSRHARGTFTGVCRIDAVATRASILTKTADQRIVPTESTQSVISGVAVKDIVS